MTIDLDALEKLADEATPGEWMTGKTTVQVCGVYSDGVQLAFARQDHDRIDGTTAKANAAFIAANNPATIKALIAELKEARGLLEPFALLAVDEENGIKGINMNDPISKWLTIAQLVDARAFLARNGKGEG